MNTNCYSFTYDGLNRLTGAGYRQNGSSTDLYDTQYTYDQMGNMLSLQRGGLHNNHTFDVIMLRLLPKRHFMEMNE